MESPYGSGTNNLPSVLKGTTWLASCVTPCHPVLDQVCSEVDVEISGTGSVSVEGFRSDITFPSDLDHRGAFSVNDAYGRAS